MHFYAPNGAWLLVSHLSSPTRKVLLFLVGRKPKGHTAEPAFIPGHLAQVHAPNSPTSLRSLMLPTPKKQTPKLGVSF